MIDDESPDAADVFIIAQQLAEVAVARHRQIIIEKTEFIQDVFG